MSDNRPIGIFDSGLGGLTVVKTLKKLLPEENIIYYGDTARVPYGTKSKKTIVEFSNENARFLLEHNVKMIVVACNTSSALAIESLKQNFAVPVVGVIRPSAARAVKITENNKIGIIGTSATVNSDVYSNIISELNSNIEIYSQACPLFVPLVEEGWLNKNVTFSIIEEYLNPLKKSNIDTLILGCTHYPLLKPALENYFNNVMTLVDSAEECALSVKNELMNLNIENETKTGSETLYYVSDMPDKFSEIGSKFLGSEFKAIKVKVV